MDNLNLLELAKSYYGKTIFLDSGPLFILLLGNLSFQQLRKIEGMREKDIVFLKNLLKNYNHILVNPQILAEISNLGNKKLPKNLFSEYIKNNVELLKSFSEEYISKNEYISNNNTEKFGITDSSIIEYCSKNSNVLLLTKDITLELMCEAKNIPVIHFDKLRAYVGLFS